MSTLGSLMSLLGETGIKPYNEQELTENRIRGGQISNQTGLLELAALRRQQETAAQARAYFAANPQALFGDQQVPQSTLGSLAPAGGGPLTQQTTVPGQPPGVPQMVPGGQDLSRFAGGLGTDPGGPPQSTLGSLAPQPQANPLMDLRRLSPDAAFAVMQRQQSQQDLALKRDEQRLGLGTKIAEYVGRVAQGVTDQASLDQARQELARVHPQAAAQLPQAYSKEAMAPFIAKALDVKESMTLQAQDLQAQAAVIKARKEGRSTDVDNQLRAMGVPPGQETPAQMKEALQAVQEGKIAVSSSHGSGQIVQTPQGFMRINPRTNQPEQIQAPGGGPLYPKPTAEEQRAASYGDRAALANANAGALEEKGLQPSLWAKVGNVLPFGMGNYLQSADRQKYEQAVRQFGSALLRKESGAAISQSEYEMTDKTYFPQPGDAQAVIAQKRAAREGIITSLKAEGKQADRPSSQSPAPAGTSGQAPATFDTADFARWRQGTGTTGNPTAADVQAYFEAKGLKRR
jgi:hypothetical protein